MNILLLCDGDAEDPHGSFSGSAHSLVSEFRRQGNRVTTVNVELNGLDRWVCAARTFSPSRERWGVKFRLGAPGFQHRSRLAERAIHTASPAPQVILQIGATFRPKGHGPIPYVLYCDSNIRMAEEGSSTGFSEAAQLQSAELDAVAEREAEVYREASTIFTLSERLRGVFLNRFQIDPGRVVTSFAGPNMPLNDLVIRTVQPERPPTILFVGKQFERKGGPLLLSAFRQVRAEIPDARLVIIGPEHFPLDQPGVVSLGYLRKDNGADWEKLKEAYNSADVFCLPTRFEPFGIVFVEAMFFGLPCIGTDAWAIPEIIRHEETGLLVPPDDEPSLVRALLRLLTGVSEARAFGLAGRQRAEQMFTWRTTVERMTKVMNRIAVSV